MTVPHNLFILDSTIKPIYDRSGTGITVVRELLAAKYNISMKAIEDLENVAEYTNEFDAKGYTPHKPGSSGATIESVPGRAKRTRGIFYRFGIESI